MQILGLAFVLIASILGFVGQDILRNPEKYMAPTQIQIEPEALRLLAYIYQLQVKYDLHKVIIGKDGSVGNGLNGIKEDINVIKEFFKLNEVNESSKVAFEKVVLKIPVTYLRNIPETRLGSPYVLAITPEGIMKIK